jgi:hypothetical protein
MFSPKRFLKVGSTAVTVVVLFVSNSAIALDPNARTKKLPYVLPQDVSICQVTYVCSANRFYDRKKSVNCRVVESDGALTFTLYDEGIITTVIVKISSYKKMYRFPGQYPVEVSSCGTPL